MEETEKRKRGRPKKNNAKTHRIQICLTDEEFENLKYVCSRKDKSMTDIVSNGIRMQANLCRCTEHDDGFDDYDSDYYD